MNRANQQKLLMGLLALAVTSGCQTIGNTTGNATVRSQSPTAQSYGAEVTKTRGLYHTPIRSAADGIQDHYHEHHNTDTYYYGTGGPAAAGYNNCPPGGANGNCPPGGAYGNCPPQYAANSCPPNGAYGQCPPGYGGHQCNSGLCQDKFSYGYEVPNDLVYPPAGGVGGAVVYPYYTFKGPSDFFRQ